HRLCAHQAARSAAGFRLRGDRARGRALLDLLRAAPEVIADGPTPDLRQTKVAQPLILSELQPRLPDQVQLVQYSVLDDKLIIWVVTRESFAARVAPVPAAELKRKVVAYLRLMTAAETSGDAE